MLHGGVQPGQDLHQAVDECDGSLGAVVLDDDIGHVAPWPPPLHPLRDLLQLVLHASERLLHGGVQPGQDLHQAVDECDGSLGAVVLDDDIGHVAPWPPPLHPLRDLLQLVLHASERLLHGGVQPGQDLHQAVDECDGSLGAVVLDDDIGHVAPWPPPLHPLRDLLQLVLHASERLLHGGVQPGKVLHQVVHECDGSLGAVVLDDDAGHVKQKFPELVARQLVQDGAQHRPPLRLQRLQEFLQLVLHDSERLLHFVVQPGQDLHLAVDECDGSLEAVVLDDDIGHVAPWLPLLHPLRDLLQEFLQLLDLFERLLHGGVQPGQDFHLAVDECDGSLSAVMQDDDAGHVAPWQPPLHPPLQPLRDLLKIYKERVRGAGSLKLFGSKLYFKLFGQYMIY
ncbi:hypothetical protein F7725_006379 [Dissostichus mawsoni]|uniref:Uncharacterized protein n=1 Tax=Dissostichus mawsoni TaxID=36200 RepID=A0A7J5XVF3_DISMA|nr:hypothetical protein F7725_006379 [Dissostichus mawsoni]